MFSNFTNEFLDKDFESNFLKYTYISPIGWFAIQPHIDDSKEAREEAHKKLGHLMNIKSNLGLQNGNPVIIDAI